MITALVQFTPPAPVPLAKVAELSAANAPLYKGMQGLIRKYYVADPVAGTVGGVYLWESRADGEACYDDAWLERVTASYGSPPEITWFETPLVLDNRHDEIVTA